MEKKEAAGSRPAKRLSAIWNRSENWNVRVRPKRWKQPPRGCRSERRRSPGANGACCRRSKFTALAIALLLIIIIVAAICGTPGVIRKCFRFRFTVEIELVPFSVRSKVEHPKVIGL